MVPAEVNYVASVSSRSSVALSLLTGSDANPPLSPTALSLVPAGHIQFRESPASAMPPSLAPRGRFSTAIDLFKLWYEPVDEEDHEA